MMSDPDTQSGGSSARPKRPRGNRGSGRTRRPSRAEAASESKAPDSIEAAPTGAVAPSTETESSAAANESLPLIATQPELPVLPAEAPVESPAPETFGADDDEPIFAKHSES